VRICGSVRSRPRRSRRTLRRRGGGARGGGRAECDATAVAGPAGHGPLLVGLGRIVALHHRSSTLHRIH
jgi:hypothetical protein